MKNIKWLPILLLYMVGAGCTHISSEERITGVTLLHNGQCSYSTSQSVVTVIVAPCGWYKIGDYPIRPLDSLTK